MKKTSLGSLLFLFLFMTTACAAEAPETPTATPPPTQIHIITATLPPTQTPLPTRTPEPTATTAPYTPIEGQTTSQLNVRKTPSSESEQVGSLQIFDKVQIIGKDPSSSWWMILFPDSSTGKGWITTQFVQVTADISSVPIIDTTVQNISPAPITEANPTGSEAVATVEPTPIYATAPQDGDSAESPAISITLSEASSSFFNYSNDISVPDGDESDWVQFLFEGKSGQERIVSVVVNCSGSSKLDIELIQNGVTLQSWADITCGQPHQLQLYLYVSAPYSLHLFPAQGNTPLNYISYDLNVQLMK